MIHVRNSLLDLHIRTTYRGGFSAVSRLALRFTTDIMEMSDDGSVWVNGALTAGAFVLDGIYPVNPVVTGSGDTEATVTLSGAQSILFTSRGRWGINIYIDAHGSDFCDSQGMAGTWVSTGFLKRDGVTPVIFTIPGFNKIEYGEEWEVDSLLGDPILFSTPSTKNCVDVPVCDPLDPYFATCFRRERARKLQVVDPVVECQNFITNPSDLDNCVFDFVVAGEQMAKNNPAYTQVWEPTQRCVPEPIFFDPDLNQFTSECERLGGTCRYRCDESKNECLEDLCKKNVNLSILEGDQEEDEPYLEGCWCAIPKETKEPTLAPSSAPTDCPQTTGYPAIAGYLPRTDAEDCVSPPYRAKCFVIIAYDCFDTNASNLSF